jgi:hypothetical protein
MLKGRVSVEATDYLLKGRVSVEATDYQGSPIT